MQIAKRVTACKTTEDKLLEKKEEYFLEIYIYMLY